MASPAMLELEGLCLAYGPPGGGARRSVLEDLELSLEAGQAVSITGPSGSGKSTLLHVMGGLAPPDAGIVRFNGEDLYQRNEEELARFRARELGFVFQAHHLLPQCTALENALVPTLVLEDTAERKVAEARARELFTRAGLSGREEQRPAELSGGEAQRVAVVRALVNGPRLVLADEPTGSLDRKTAETIAELLIELVAGAGTTLVLVTHSEALAERMAVRYQLEGGRLERRSG